MPDTTFAVCQIDAHGRIVSASEQFCRTLHCTESSLIGRDARELLLDGYRAAIRPQTVAKPATTKPWWEWRPSTFNQVWDFDADQLAAAS